MVRKVYKGCFCINTMVKPQNKKDENIYDNKDNLIKIKENNLKELETPYFFKKKQIRFKTLNTNIVNKELQEGLKISLQNTGQQSSIKLLDKGNYYEIEDGNHRVKQFIEMGYSADKIKWKIIKKSELDSYGLEVNYLRGDPAPMPIALKLKDFKNLNYTPEQIHEKTGFPISQIRRYISFLDLPDEMSIAITNSGPFTPLHAYYVSTKMRNDDEGRWIIYNAIISEKLSVNETKARINDYNREEGKNELVKDLLGFIPYSVWDTKKIETLVHYIEDKRAQGTYGENLLGYLSSQESTSAVSIGSLKNWSPLSRNTRESMFNPSIAIRCFKMWSNDGDIVFDPCAGGGTRVKIADMMARKAIGIDINKEHINQCNSEKTLAYCRDSTEPYDDIIKNEVDYILTCPPYWNIETYGNKESSALENTRTYDEYLLLLKKMLTLASNKLKLGKYMTIVVSDFRAKGNYYNLHSDVINICENIGLKVHDIVIAIVHAAIQNTKQCFDSCYTQRTHEFILTFKKEVVEE